MYSLRLMFPTLKISFDPAGESKNDPCMMEIECAKGVIYPHSNTHLALECKTYTAKQILNLVPNTIVHQQGDSEWTILFSLEDFGKVTEVVKPRKRRMLSEQRKAQAIERLRKWQYK